MGNGNLGGPVPGKKLSTRHRSDQPMVAQLVVFLGCLSKKILDSL